MVQEKQKKIFLVDLIIPIPVNKIFTYYLSKSQEKKIQIGCRVIVPFGRKNKEKIAIVYRKYNLNNNTNIYKKVNLVIDKKPILNKSQIKLFEWVSKYYMSNISNTFKLLIPSVLLSKKVIENYEPKTINYLKLNNNLNIRNLIKEVKYKSQKKIILAYSSIKKKNGDKYEIKESEIINMNLSKNSLKTLINKNIINRYKKNISRIEKLRIIESPKKLNQRQDQSFKKIIKTFREKDIVLLMGLNYLDRLNIYIKMIKREIDKGNRILYLLPELFFNNEIILKFKKIFGDKLGIYNSKLSNNHKIETFFNILNGKYNLILGVQSAIFLPLKKLSLTIIDEEGENIFKQNRKQPKYNARDVSIIFSKINKSKVLLGSNTPSLETYYNSINNNFGLIKYDYNYKNVKKPEITIINTLEKKIKKKMKGNFSDTLIKEIKNTLKNKKQVIIYNSKKNELEDLKDELLVIFPNVELEIIHYDLSIKKIREVLKKIKNNLIQIIVGNQIINKIFSFKKVSLVGIINTEKMLNIPNFRSTEKTFQIIHQITNGNIFRDSKSGKVIIQTLNPNVEIYNSLKNYHVTKFYKTELNERKKFNYPPFSRLIKIEFNNKLKNLAEIEAKNFYKKINNFTDKNNILGPTESKIYKPMIYLKVNKEVREINRIKNSIKTILKDHKMKSNTSIDVDPNF